ncbi:hypothetical protein CL619_02225 [archaeon]|nr:hypothetical protein [archaeon]
MPANKARTRKVDPLLQLYDQTSTNLRERLGAVELPESSRIKAVYALQIAVELLENPELTNSQLEDMIESTTFLLETYST